jgi:phenylacetaldehyde dehydrogenase
MTGVDTTMSNYPSRAQLDLIRGEWSEPREVSQTLHDPNTGEPRQQQTVTPTAEVERAIDGAAKLHDLGSWALAPIDVRAQVLRALAAGLDARIDELAYEDAMSTGNPLTTTTRMASYLAPRVLSALDQVLQIGDDTPLPAGERTVRLLRRPLGPAAVLAPWNAPTFVAVAKIASALAAGCPVVVKPSEWAPAGCQIVAEVMAEIVESLRLDPAVFQLVHGAAEVGGQLASDRRIRAISFTGGGIGGQAVAAAAAPHFTALQLELGGHNPVIVHPDADIGRTATALAEGMTKLNGQWCEAPGKVLVADHVHDELVHALLERLGRLHVGHCLDAASDVGPLAYHDHRARLQCEIDRLVDRGGKALTNSNLPDLAGWFMAPTVVVDLDARESERELFGPAVTVHAVGSIEEAIAAASGPGTGLDGFVFGTDLDLALRTAARIPAGEIRINGCHLADLADGSEQTFWNDAGIGGHGPTDMVRFFQGRRVIGVDDTTLPI